jgi:putative transposase
VRHEWLGRYLFVDIKGVRDTATEWRWTYNHERLNMALGGITPAQKLNRQMETQISAGVLS